VTSQTLRCQPANNTELRAIYTALSTLHNYMANNNALPLEATLGDNNVTIFLFPTDILIVSFDEQICILCLQNKTNFFKLPPLSELSEPNWAKSGNDISNNHCFMPLS